MSLADKVNENCRENDLISYNKTFVKISLTTLFSAIYLYVITIAKNKLSIGICIIPIMSNCFHLIDSEKVLWKVKKNNPEYSIFSLKIKDLWTLYNTYELYLLLEILTTVILLRLHYYNLGWIAILRNIPFYYPYLSNKICSCQNWYEYVHSILGILIFSFWIYDIQKK